MTSRRSVSQPQRPRRTLPPRPRPVVPALDLALTAVLRHGALTLVADPQGDIRPDARGLGLYLGDTRVLSSLVLLVDGGAPTLLGSDGRAPDHDTVQVTNTARDLTAAGAGDDALPAMAVGIRRERSLGPGGLRERVEAVNFTTSRRTVSLTLLLDADGADIFEVRGYPRARRGELLPVEVGASAIRFGYRGIDRRRLTTSVVFSAEPDRIESAPPAADASAAAVWELELGPGEVAELGWSVAAAWSPRHPVGARLEPRRPRSSGGTRTATAVATSDPLLDAVLARGLSDVDLLATVGPGPGEAFLAAGVPWFATLFGRDAILAALFLLPFRPGLAASTLRALARLQAASEGDGPEAEPGKILHEFRAGEMASTGEVPFARSYGTADATPLWLLLLAGHHAWAGDDTLVDELWPNVLRAVAWLDAHVAADGLVTYRTRTPHGPRNHGWKDSEDSVRDRHGAIAEPPIALIEVQAYAVGAYRAIAGLAERRGEAVLATRLRTIADGLAARVEARFWCPDLGRYAMALDGRGHAADALASNVGHALWQGALPAERAAVVARDLAGPLLSSGWGVRTYASGQPGYNPIGYHLGTVWPHDTAIVVAGLRRYGFDREAAVLADGLLDAARLFPLQRLPEAFCGFARDGVARPVGYPVACAPQAWAATAPFMLLRAMLGIDADAPSRTLRITRPLLPRGVDRVAVRGLRVGDASVDLRVRSRRGVPRVEVVRRRGDLSIVTA